MNKSRRVPFWVESPRGDDKLGTDPETGNITSDAKAAEEGKTFEKDIPADKIQEAVEGQLRDKKWVTLENQDGNTELLTEKDIPKDDDEVLEGEDENLDGNTEESGQEGKEEAPLSWKDAFKVMPPPQKNTPKAGSKTPAAACQTSVKKPESPKEKWTSKFENIKSATATHQVKPG